VQHQPSAFPMDHSSRYILINSDWQLAFAIKSQHVTILRNKQLHEPDEKFSRHIPFFVAENHTPCQYGVSDPD
jgi:hypothetical protein